MKLVRFLLIQSLLLGTGAFVVWVPLATHPSGLPSFSLDTAAALGFSIALTGAFLVAVALPLQLLVRSLASRLAAGVLAGPVGVFAGLLLFSGHPVNWEWYVTNAWALHMVFTLVGAAFGWACWSKLRSNDSSKPMPLRGTA